ncbi:hypothetical protein [Acinetobacter sp. SH20PTE14]|uniref:hypothetical protein n=1 Tax=Acinetobacter sp. SH20PTE14 TaxID=2905879 RepID=UPI001F3917FF|nr:hypothetical protein [Acinetobacter sp. SH20PTE14]UIJ76927.1 hypothetical protein LXF01_06675 [Acinetobacter sp. SH20PTE14]UIJ76990.1 hypothetical protein LXF01_07005 [Acinetobacter sp. SH20PTE14]
MREYGKVSPHFWTGSTGKQLRQCPESLVVSMYLMTSPHANMLGLYYMPLLYVAHETGLGMEGASKGLQWACEAGFCSYDHASEMVWVHEMARFQIADKLKSTDKRSIGVQNEYNSLPSNPYLASFYDKYSQAFCMTEKRQNTVKKVVKNEAPSKPLASQEQEQEQEQENTHTNAQEDFSESDHWKPDLEQLAIALRTTKYSRRVSEILGMEDFQFHLGNFNTHHENNHQLTDNQKLRKFAQWIFQEFEKQLAKTEREAKKSTGRIPEKQNSRNVNDAWGEVQHYAPASDNVELEDLV